MQQTKNKKAMWNPILVIGIIIVVALMISGTDFIPGAIILKSDNPNVIYQYSGDTPLSPKANCALDSEFASNDIVFSDTQQISSNGYNYEFKITDVEGSNRLDKSICVNCASGCGYNFYRAEVTKDGELIDTINFNPDALESSQKWTTLPLECNSIPASFGIGGGHQLRRDYGDVVATFQFAYENIRNTGCGGAQQYIVNRYEIIPDEVTIVEETEDVIIVAEPINRQFVQISDKNFFSSLLDSIRDFFRRLFG